jgi:aryl-alcohol dehydrogenase-like predicted oxidoreductase
VPVTNKIILGTVQFGLNYGINNTSGKPNQQQVNDILDTAYNAGINYLDTAEAYGDAHYLIGQYHKQNPQQKFKVITKFPHHIDENLDQKIEKYLQELHVPTLEAILFHSYQTYQDNKKAIGLLNKYKQLNKIKYIGVSVYTNAQIESVIEDDDIDIIQFPFNLFDNVNQRGYLIEKAKNKGKLLHVRSVFLQGLFFTSPDTDNKVVRALLPELNYIHQLSVKWQISLQQIALSYSLQQPGIDNVLIGIDNTDQLKQNLNYADAMLPAQLVNEVNKINIHDIDLLNPSLWDK